MFNYPGNPTGQTYSREQLRELAEVMRKHEILVIAEAALDGGDLPVSIDTADRDPVTGIIGLANDELGYILPKEDYRYPLNPLNPKDHYEETMSISKHIGPQLMKAVDDLLVPNKKTGHIYVGRVDNNS